MSNPAKTDNQPWYFRSHPGRRASLSYWLRIWLVVALFLMLSVALVLIIWLGLLPRGGFSD